MTRTGRAARGPDQREVLSQHRLRWPLRRQGRIKVNNLQEVEAIFEGKGFAPRSQSQGPCHKSPAGSWRRLVPSPPQVGGLTASDGPENVVPKTFCALVTS